MDDEKTKNIETILREIAAVHALRLGYNTHYEAYNYEFDWWEGGNHHRLDFQHKPDRTIKIVSGAERSGIPDTILIVRPL